MIEETKIVREWKHAGLRCLLVLTRTPIMEYFCGYIAVAKGHGDWGKDKDEIDVEVHGHLTYAARGDDSNVRKDPELWWFGFDTAHAGDQNIREDWLQAHQDFPEVPRKVMKKWSAEEAFAETERLAEQFAARMR